MYNTYRFLPVGLRKARAEEGAKAKRLSMRLSSSLHAGHDYDIDRRKGPWERQGKVEKEEIFYVEDPKSFTRECLTKDP